jgi:hypothetical protein
MTKDITGKPFPLGFSVMLLRGAISDLENAKSKASIPELIKARKHLVDSINKYHESIKNAPSLSIVTRALRNIGDESIQKAEAQLNNYNCSKLD